MVIDLEFPGGLRVDALVGRHRIRTDQSTAHGGEDSAPSPFTLFLASLATCAGFFALSFCQRRELSTVGLATRLETHAGPAGGLERITIRLTLPDGFPIRYRAAIQRSVEQCSVHRFVATPAPIAIEVDPRAPELSHEEHPTARVGAEPVSRS